MDRNIEEEYWVLEFTEGDYKGKFFFITEHHQNVSWRDTPRDCMRYSTREKALNASEYFSLRFTMEPRHVKTVYSIRQNNGGG